MTDRETILARHKLMHGLAVFWLQEAIDAIDSWDAYFFKRMADHFIRESALLAAAVKAQARGTGRFAQQRRPRLTWRRIRM